MSVPAPDLNALLGSRICHDLISPLGAISNGLELLAMAGVAPGPELTLISESVENAKARILFFRVAFGAASPGQEIGRTEILSILGPLATAKLRVEWQPQQHPLRSEVKLAFLLIQCLETAMPWGGTINVAWDVGHWRITGTADRLKPLPDLWPVVMRKGGCADIAPNHVHFPLADRAAAELGRRISVSLSPEAIALSF